jgi:hypothetical protein
LENGEDGFIYVGNSVNPVILEQLFGVSSLSGVPNQVSLVPPDVFNEGSQPRGCINLFSNEKIFLFPYK